MSASKSSIDITEGTDASSSTVLAPGSLKERSEEDERVPPKRRRFDPVDDAANEATKETVVDDAANETAPLPCLDTISNEPIETMMVTQPVQEMGGQQAATTNAPDHGRNQLQNNNPALAQFLLAQLERQQHRQQPLDNFQQYLLSSQLMQQQQQQINFMSALNRKSNFANPQAQMYSIQQPMQQTNLNRNPYNNSMTQNGPTGSLGQFMMGSGHGMGMNMALPGGIHSTATGSMAQPGFVMGAGPSAAPSQQRMHATASNQHARVQENPALPAILAQPDDHLKLSTLQCFLRYQIEAFRAHEDDILTHTRGRNKPIAIGQVGIRCKFCAHLPVARRQKGSTYFPASRNGIYQAAQNMSAAHMCSGICTEMPMIVKQQLAIFAATKAPSSGAGRPYWAHSAANLGLVDTEDGIRHVHDVRARQQNAAAAVTETTTRSGNESEAKT